LKRKGYQQADEGKMDPIKLSLFLYLLSDIFRNY